MTVLLHGHEGGPLFVVFCGLHSVRGHRNKDVGLLPHQLGCQLGKPPETAAFMPELNEQVLSPSL